MMKTSFVIFCMLIATTAVASTGGNIGILDDRTYGSLQDSTYSSIARFKANGAVCTSGFIAPNIVLTNKHCVSACGTPGACTVNFWNGHEYVDTAITKIIAIGSGSGNNTTNGGDWAILQSADSNPNFKSVAAKTTTGPVNRGGFGGMRVIENSEVDALKAIFIETTERYRAECEAKERRRETDFYSCVFKHFNDELKKRGYKPVLGDSANFKIQRCNITGDLSGARKMVATDCDSAGGDSGAPLLRGNSVVALNNSGPHTFFMNNENKGANAVKTENFYSAAQSAIARFGHSTPSPTPPHNNNNNNNNHNNNNNNNNNNNHNNNNNNNHNNNNNNHAGGNNHPMLNIPGVNTILPSIPGGNITLPPISGGNTTPTTPGNNNNTPAPNPPATEPPATSPEPPATGITDPNQIQQILNQEIMQFECD